MKVMGHGLREALLEAEVLIEAREACFLGLEPSRLAVGRGPALEDPSSAIDRAIGVAGRKVGDRSLRGARGVA